MFDAQNTTGHTHNDGFIIGLMGKTVMFSLLTSRFKLSFITCFFQDQSADKKKKFLTARARLRMEEA